MCMVDPEDKELLTEKFSLISNCCSEAHAHEWKIEKYLVPGEIFFVPCLKLNPKIAGDVHIEVMMKTQNKFEQLIYKDCITKDEYVSRALTLYPLLMKLISDDEEPTLNEYYENKNYRIFDQFVNIHDHYLFYDSVNYSALKQALKFIYDEYKDELTA